MKKGVKISKKWNKLVILTLILCLLTGLTGYSQRPNEFSLSIYPGFTLVNFEEALDYSDDYLRDWSEFYLGVAGRGFLFSTKPFKLGAEVAWQQLYYAYYTIPYGTSPVYREFNVTTLSFMLLGRYSAGSFFSCAGAGIHIFNNGIAPALCLEAGYIINNSSAISFPISFRISPVFGDGTPTPFSVGFGVSYTIAQ